jgi:hypothetical protein
VLNGTGDIFIQPLLAARSGEAGGDPPSSSSPRPLPGSPPLPPPEGSAEAARLPRMAAAGPSFGWRRFLRGGGAVRGGPAGHGDGGGVRRRILRPFARIRPSPHLICGLRPSPYPPSLPSPRTPPVAPLASAVGGGCCCRSTAPCSALGAACLRPRPPDLSAAAVGPGLLCPGRGLTRGLACRFCCGGGGARPALCPSSVACCGRRPGPSVPGGPRPVRTTRSLEVATGPWWPCRRRSTRGSASGIKVMLMVAFLQWLPTTPWWCGGWCQPPRGSR